MTAASERLRCLWIPLRGVNMLLPNMAVAEIGSYRVPDELPGTPDWLLGTIRWREQVVAVISLEILCGHKVPANMACSRLVIVNSLRQGSPVRFYAIVAAGLPRLLQFGNEIVSRVETCELDMLHCRVVVERQKAVLPNLEHIQELLEGYPVLAA